MAIIYRDLCTKNLVHYFVVIENVRMQQKHQIAIIKKQEF